MICSDKPHPFIDRRLFLKYGIIKPLYIDLDVTPHIICAGGTGSGKSTLAKILLGHCIMACSNAIVAYSDAAVCSMPDIYILDFKGLDYAFLDTKQHYYACSDYSNGLDSFFDRFQARLQKEETACNRCFLLLDEFNSYIASIGDKKLQEAYKNKLASIVNMSRAYKMHVILCGQRIDSSLVGTCRDSFGCRIGLSALSRETYDILFPNFPEFRSTAGRFGFGEGYLSIEGDPAGLHEIIIPAIADMGKLERLISQSVR